MQTIKQLIARLDPRKKRYYPTEDDAFNVRFCFPETKEGIRMQPVKYLTITPCKTGGHTMYAVSITGAKVELDPARREDLWVIYNNLRVKA